MSQNPFKTKPSDKIAGQDKLSASFLKKHREELEEQGWAVIEERTLNLPIKKTTIRGKSLIHSILDDKAFGSEE